MKAINLFKPKSAVALLLVLMLTLLAACGANSGDGGNGGAATNNGSSAVQETATPEPSPSEEPAAEEANETQYPYTITDATNTAVTFEAAPTSIVTLVPSETETAFAIGAGELVIGVDSWSNYPEAAAAIEKIGDMTTNIEAVTALNPELVLASSTMNADAVAQLRELGLNVYATDPKTYDEVVAKIQELGKIMNMQQGASEVAAHMNQVKEQVSSAVKAAEAKKVYLEFSPGWTVGSGEFLDELITLAGGINISAGVPGWSEVNAEEVITQNPQLIIYPDFGEEKSSIVAAIEERPGWEVIDAVKNAQLFAVTNDPLVRVGPRLADGLLELAKVIHSDLLP